MKSYRAIMRDGSERVITGYDMSGAILAAGLPNYDLVQCTEIGYEGVGQRYAPVNIYLP